MWDSQLGHCPGKEPVKGGPGLWGQARFLQAQEGDIYPPGKSFLTCACPGVPRAGKQGAGWTPFSASRAEPLDLSLLQREVS